jgi:anthranilate phosphoribosyltransferase
MIREAIGTLVRGESLTIEEAASVMEEIMDGKTTPAQLGSFITALSIKGETGEEIAGLARVMRSRATQVTVDGPVLDIVGTGGDGLNTFNISTAAAFVAAGADIKVAKHGNRAASSQCGSADVLEKLGVKIDLNAGQVRNCIQEVGLGFMFAPNFHPAMKYAAGPRKEIGIRTVFNILGPLTNPAQAEYQVIGVPNLELAEKIVAALIRLGSRHALVLHGLNGMDEISITGRSMLWEIKNGELTKWQHHVSPEDFGLKKAPLTAVTGGSPEENAATIREIFGGATGAKRDIVLMNAAAALVAGNKVETLQEGVALAQEIIDRKLAFSKLELLIEFTQNLSKDNNNDSGQDSTK